jgi:diguanylate cyclase (GGDEF)-like protein/PAS domain S-box-containing protein
LAGSDTKKRPLITRPIFRDKHFYILLAFFIICTLFYYFGEMVNLFGWNALRWEIFYTVHDLHRMLFLVPILYSSYYYRLRGAVLANMISLIIFLPRAFFISPYPDATLRMIVFVIVAIVISMLSVRIFNERDKSNKSADALKQSEEKYRDVLNQMYDSYYEVDLAGNFTFVNDATCLNLGYSREELIGNNFQIALSENNAKTVFQAYHVVYISGEPNKGFAFEVTRKDGSRGFAESSVSLRKNERGQIIGFRSISRDITERKQAEEALRESEDALKLVFNAVGTGILVIESETQTILEVNQTASKMIGRSKEEMVGHICHSFVCPAEVGKCPVKDLGQAIDNSERKIICADGQTRSIIKSVSPLIAKGRQCYLESFIDITERKMLEQKLEELATHDYLTGLPNRVLLTDRFSMAAALAQRNKARLAIMSLDLDKFKIINDTLGHAAGDQVLKTISTRLTGIIRAGDTIARVGGDEFVLVMLETRSKEDATTIAHKILDAFAEPLLIDGHQVHLSTSVGIAIYPEDAEDMETLVKKSDAAMYYSKGHGRNQFKFFSDGDVSIGGDHKSGPPIRG